MNPSTKEIRFEAISKASFQEYISTGIRSYRQHYLHLWPNQDPTPYIESSFTIEVLAREIEDPNNRHFLVYYKEVPAGILKIVLNRPIDAYSAKEAIHLEKVYLLSEFTGRRLGAAVLNFVTDYGRSKGKRVLWLGTMKKGPALGFYLKNGFEITSEKLLSLPGALKEERPMFILLKKL